MAEDNGAANAVSFTALKPQLVVSPSKVEEAVEFYKAAFGAEEVKRSTYPKRKGDDQETHVLCAELKIGGSIFIVCEQTDDLAAVGCLIFRLETDDVEPAIKNAEKAGAVIISEIAEEEEGDGCCDGVVGTLKDPFSVVWTVASPGKKRCGEPQA